MTTIFIFWTRPLDVNRGGVHRIIYILLTRLIKMGYEVYYVYTEDNYQSFRVHNNPNLFIKRNELRQYLIDNHCDIILGQDAVYSSDLSVLVKEMCLPRVKYVAEYHNSILLLESAFSRHYYKFMAQTSDSTISKIIYYFKQLTYPIWYRRSRAEERKNFLINSSIADKVLFLSEAEIPEVLRLAQCSKDKLVAINNPLSWDKIEDPSILNNKRKEVLIVSRLYNPEKRIDRALKVWQILESRGYTDWVLKIVGEGPHFEYLQKLSKQLNLKKVKWEGRQSSYSYYQTASIFMMTSACEGWGLTLTESMQTGTVPVAMDSYPALHNIITDGYDGCIIPDDDIQAYADKMEWLMNHPNERNEIAKNGLKSCRRFTIENIMNQWNQMLKQL